MEKKLKFTRTNTAAVKGNSGYVPGLLSQLFG